MKKTKKEPKTKFFKVNGFGLVDGIISLSLLAGIITYGVYFSTLRLGTVHYSNLIRSINKEIERDIERLKLDLWSLDYEKNKGEYLISLDDCDDFTSRILNLNSWSTNNNSSNSMIQSWRPNAERGKVFSGQKVLITRELNVISGLFNQSLNRSIANVNYKVEWGDNNINWLNIYLSPEVHSWCEQPI
ncbi:hypothetical protein OA518_01385 [Prochlorococcus sp. AH-716-F10]|nr:hypothetical protein [Prochlorococcus sp. AH-716-F10]